VKRVYIIDFGNMIKVGVSGNIEQRLISLPVKGERRFYCTDQIENAFDIERKMHESLRQHMVKIEKSREYFDFDFDKAVNILEELTLGKDNKNRDVLSENQKKMILMGALLPAIDKMTDYECGYFVGKLTEIAKRK